MMPSSKKMMREFSLIRFYCILVISLLYFALQLVTSHLTHSLILQVDAYHMLYNILSLIICILTIRMSRTSSTPNNGGTAFEISEASTTEDIVKEKSKLFALKNTFGWTRIDVCGAVACLCFLSALGFSVVVECLQTMFHASHHDSMHHPISVAIVGVIGLAVNMICFLTIGGYTFHQSSFLSSNHAVGDDVIISASVQSYVQKGIKSRRRQGFMETVRDVFGTVLVIVVAVVMLLIDKPTETSAALRATKFVAYLDPVCCIIVVIVLAMLSFSYAKEAGHILLLTIPDHINVKSLLKELQTCFPEIVDIHDVHVWQLTPARIIASAHIVLQHAQGYLAIQNNIVDFLHSKGISHITLQPEFLQVDPLKQDSPATRRKKCFLPCGDQDDCREQWCCEGSTLTPCNSSTPIDPYGGHHHHHHADHKSTFNSADVAEIEINDEDNAEAEMQPMI